MTKKKETKLMTLTQCYDYVFTKIFIYFTNIKSQLEKVTYISYLNNTTTTKSQWIFKHCDFW